MFCICGRTVFEKKSCRKVTTKMQLASEWSALIRGLKHGIIPRGSVRRGKRGGRAESLHWRYHTWFSLNQGDTVIFHGKNGGEEGIRTLETLRPTRFPSERTRPGYATSPCSYRISDGNCDYLFSFLNERKNSWRKNRESSSRTPPSTCT